VIPLPSPQRVTPFIPLVLPARGTVALVYAAIFVIPPCLANFGLQNALRNDVLFAYSGRKPEDQIRAEVFQEVKRRGIPVRREDIEVHWSAEGLRVAVKYNVPLNIPGVPYSITFILMPIA
jgi:hypothetical protein